MQNIGNSISYSVYFWYLLWYFFKKIFIKTKRELNVLLMFECAMPFSHLIVFIKTPENASEIFCFCVNSKEKNKR